jgi:hypothetical protein
MKVNSLVEVIMAAHLSASVDHHRFPQRGGIMLVAPPGSLKSTILKTSLDEYPDALILSDINVQTLNPLRDDIAAGKINTLAFPALEKIYERHSSTASNIEGTLKAMVDEGFREASYENHQMLGKFEARCQVTGAIIPAIYRLKFQQWNENGMLRRFLWCFYKLSDPTVIIRAIHQWRHIEFGNEVVLRPKRIDLNVTDSESQRLEVMLRYQHGKEVPLIMLKKILSVLKWRYRNGDETQPMKIIKDFSECLEEKPANLIVDSPNERREPKRKGGSKSVGKANPDGSNVRPQPKQPIHGKVADEPGRSKPRNPRLKKPMDRKVHSAKE